VVERVEIPDLELGGIDVAVVMATAMTVEKVSGILNWWALRYSRKSVIRGMRHSSMTALS
jgi:hypothetical protein